MPLKFLLNVLSLWDEAMPYITAQPSTSIDQSWKYIHGMVCDPLYHHVNGSDLCCTCRNEFSWLNAGTW